MMKENFVKLFTCGAGCIRARVGAVPKTYQPTYSFQLLDFQRGECARRESSRTTGLRELFSEGFYKR